MFASQVRSEKEKKPHSKTSLFVYIYRNYSSYEAFNLGPLM